MKYRLPLICAALGSALMWSLAAHGAEGTGSGTDSMMITRGAGALGEMMAAPEIGYYDLKPDFTTNLYSAGGSRLHYIRVKMSLMLIDNRDSAVIASIEPMIRDVIVTTLGARDYASISSASGRESLRQECKAKISELLAEREERDIIQDLLFTNYIYQ